MHGSDPESANLSVTEVGGDEVPAEGASIPQDFGASMLVFQSLGVVSKGYWPSLPCFLPSSPVPPSAIKSS